MMVDLGVFGGCGAGLCPCGVDFGETERGSGRLEMLWEMQHPPEEGKTREGKK